MTDDPIRCFLGLQERHAPCQISAWAVGFIPSPTSMSISPQITLPFPALLCDGAGTGTGSLFYPQVPAVLSVPEVAFLYLKGLQWALGSGWQRGAVDNALLLILLIMPK